MQTAEAAEHPVSTCLGLTWMTPLLMYMGDLETAERYLLRLEKDADEEHGLVSYQVVAQGIRGELLLAKATLRERSSYFGPPWHDLTSLVIEWLLHRCLGC